MLKKPGEVAHTCEPSIGKEETSRQIPGALWPTSAAASVSDEFQVMGETLSPKLRWTATEEDA